MIGTVVMPAYNAAATIAASLDSIAAAIAYLRARRGGSVGIVVVDDASTDDTVSRVTAWAAERPHLAVQLLRHERNRGCGSARNTGVKHASGSYLWFLDADDLFLPPHLFVGAMVLNQRQDFGFVQTGVLLPPGIHPDWVRRIAGSIVATRCVRRVCFDYVGGFPEDQCFVEAGLEDVVLAKFLRLAFVGAVTDTPTVNYTLRPGNNLDRQFEKFRHPYSERHRFLQVEMRGRENAIREAVLTEARLKAELNRKRELTPCMQPPSKTTDQRVIYHFNWAPTSRGHGEAQPANVPG